MPCRRVVSPFDAPRIVRARVKRCPRYDANVGEARRLGHDAPTARESEVVVKRFHVSACVTIAFLVTVALMSWVLASTSKPPVRKVNPAPRHVHHTPTPPGPAHRFEHRSQMDAFLERGVPYQADPMHRVPKRSRTGPDKGQVGAAVVAILGVIAIIVGMLHAGFRNTADQSDPPRASEEPGVPDSTLRARLRVLRNGAGRHGQRTLPPVRRTSIGSVSDAL